jgi:hypothetical protein
MTTYLWLARGVLPGDAAVVEVGRRGRDEQHRRADRRQNEILPKKLLRHSRNFFIRGSATKKKSMEKKSDKKVTQKMNYVHMYACSCISFSTHRVFALFFVSRNFQPTMF